MTKRKIIKARDTLIDIVKHVRSTYDERDMDAIINPLESAIYALGAILSKV